MNKRNLRDGISCIVIAVVCLLITFHPGIRTAEHLTGLARSYFIVGVLAVGRYLYYNSRGNRELYREIRENEEIEFRDELREKIREKAGWYAYQLGVYLIVLAMIVFVILEAFGIMRDTDTIVVCFGTYLVVQVIAERVIYKYIAQKY